MTHSVNTQIYDQELIKAGVAINCFLDGSSGCSDLAEALHKANDVLHTAASAAIEDFMFDLRTLAHTCLQRAIPRDVSRLCDAMIQKIEEANRTLFGVGRMHIFSEDGDFDTKVFVGDSDQVEDFEPA